MNVFSSLFTFKAKPKITEKMLEQNNYKIVQMSDIKIDKSSPLAITGSGTFYKGTYKTEPCSIKIIDITRDETIINEFFIWDLYKGHNNFLQFQGVALLNSEAYLVFDFFAFTIQYALENNLISDQNRNELAKQCLNILLLLQKEKKKTTDIRPGVFGITDNKCVKLLDFGLLINSDRLTNNDIIVKDRLKYQPPEYFNYQGEDVNYDIWSFGCLLIDLFSIEAPIYRTNLSQTELAHKIQKEVYPEMPKDISPILCNILNRCFEKNYKRRINIEDLIDNLQIFFNDIEPNENNKDIIHEFSFDDDNRLEKCYQFSKESDVHMNKTINLLNSGLLSGTEELVDIVNGYHINAVKRLNDNYSMIKESLDMMYKMNQDILMKFKEKIVNSILIMKQYFSFTMTDIGKTKKMSNEIRRGIDSLTNFTNIEGYKKMIETYERAVEQMMVSIKKFSEKEPYDKIQKTYYENNSMIEMYREISLNSCLTLQDITNSINNHKGLFNNDYNIRGLAEKLGMEDEVLEQLKKKTAVLNKRKVGDLYVKAQDNSSIIIVYNMYTKKINHIQLPEVNNSNLSLFNPKSYSYYDMATKTVYLTGGLFNPNNKHSYDNSVFKIVISISPSPKEDIEFKIEKLENMNNERCSHSMIKYNEDYYFAIGGLNTKTCEIYSVSNNKWGDLPELPSLAPNPGCVMFDNCLYVFTGASAIDALFRMSMSNLDKYIEGIGDREQYLKWENIDYYMPGGKLKRGMGICPIARSLVIFGGFDNANMFDDVYQISLKLEDMDKGINIVKSRETMPNKTYFSSNIVMLDNTTLIMIDGFNNALEYDVNTKEFYYYT